MPDINIKADVKKTSTLGKVRILVEQVVGSPSQEAISQAVADYIDSHPGALSPLSQATKSALLQIAEKVAYIDENGQDYYDALDAALNATELLQITAVYTQSGTVYDTDSLDSLKSDLVVTAYYDDSTTADVTSASTLSGTLAEGTSTVTVTLGGKTATFTVDVTSSVYQQIYLINWSVTSQNGGVPYIAQGTGSNAPRASMVAPSGEHPFRLNSTTGSYSDYYPVKIPEGAKGVRVTSNYLDVGCVELYYNGSDWIRLTSAGWMNKTSGTVHTYTFTDSRTTHITAPFREAGKDSGNVTQAMIDEMQYEFTY